MSLHARLDNLDHVVNEISLESALRSPELTPALSQIQWPCLSSAPGHQGLTEQAWVPSYNINMHELHDSDFPRKVYLEDSLGYDRVRSVGRICIRCYLSQKGGHQLGIRRCRFFVSP